MATRDDSKSAPDLAVQTLYMGRDAGVANYRDWKRTVDMRLSKKDEDLLHLVTHGERSELEQRILKGKLVTAGLRIKDESQMAKFPQDKEEFDRIGEAEK